MINCSRRLVRFAIAILVSTVNMSHAQQHQSPDRGQTCDSSADVMTGDAVRLSSNPHYLEFRGKPILLVGDSITQGWMESGENFDQQAYVEALSQRNINAILLWTMIAVVDQQADERFGYDAPEIWPWIKVADHFDLNRFNEAYFRRLRELVELANAHDIVVVITIHDGWPKTRFAGHPFNVTNGGPLTDRSQYVDLHDYDREMPTEFDPTWDRRQQHQYHTERFTARLLLATADLPNVVYEVFNEGNWYDQAQLRAFQVHTLKFIKARTDRLLVVNDDHVGGENFHGEPDADILSDHKPKWDKLALQDVLPTFFNRYEEHFQEKPFKPYFFSEPVPSFGGELTQLPTLTRLLWSSALGGASVFLQNDTSFGFDSHAAMASKRLARRKMYDLEGYLAVFFGKEVVNLQHMKPQGSLASTGICLAQRGVQYIVYAPDGKELTVDLSDGNDRAFAVRWYDPVWGVFLHGDAVAGGQQHQRFHPPLETDAVLHLVLDKTEYGQPFRASPKIHIARGQDPDVAVAEDGIVHVAYVRDGNVYYRSALLEGPWSDEILLGLGVDPCIALGPEGEPHVAATDKYAGTTKRGGASIRYCKRDEQGFGSLRVIVSDGACRKPRIQVDSAGCAVVSYEDRRHDGQRVRCVSIAPDGEISSTIVCGEDNNGGLAVDPNGTRFLTWRKPRNKRIYCTALTAQGKIRSPVCIGPVSSDFSEIVVDPSDGSLHVAGVIGGARGIYCVRRTPEGLWNTPQAFKFPEALRVKDADNINPAMAIDAVGRRYVTFAGAAMLSYFFVVDPHGKASPLSRVDPSGGRTEGKYKNPHLSTHPSGGVLVTWASEGTVFLARLSEGRAAKP